MKCPYCGKEISNKDTVVLDRDSVRTIARNSKKLVIYLSNVLGEKIDARARKEVAPK